MKKAPKDRLAGYEWLHDEFGVALIKLKRQGKEPVGGEKGWNVRKRRRPFKDIGLGKNDNAGVLTGRISGIIVLDIDNEILFPKEYDIPSTFCVKTSKGVHHYFRLPGDGKPYGNRSIPGEGFDIRAGGGYVVAPWSRHPDGSKYEILVETEIAAAPQWLLGLAESKTVKGKKRISPSTQIQPPQVTPFPGGVTPLPHLKEVIEEGVEKGKRSERIWHVIKEHVEKRYTGEEIRFIFEKNPQGIGEKYYEKGAGRVAWIQSQIDKASEEYNEKHIDPVKASNQPWVDQLAKDVLNTFRSEYGMQVSESHERVIENVANLLVALYEGSIKGWFNIPLPVGAGKTQIIYHFIKFLYKNDTSRTFSVSLAFEKISEIDDAARWLTKHGVTGDYFQVVHHKVPDVAQVLAKLDEIPVVLHTHYKLKGAAYTDEYFHYQGKPRGLLVYDESLLNSMVSSWETKDAVAEIDKFLRKWDLDMSFRGKVQKEICDFFSDFKKLVDKEEGNLGIFKKQEIELNVDTTPLDKLDYAELVKAARIIEEDLRTRDFFRDILLVCKAPKQHRKLTIFIEKGKPAMLACKELLSDNIENLVNLDASRESRRLFKYTTRDDKRIIQVYDAGHFRWDDELYIVPLAMSSGKESVTKAFIGDKSDNDYLREIEKIVRNHSEQEEEETAMNQGVCPGKRKYLFFYSKHIQTLPYQVKEMLARKGLIPLADADDRLNFVTFGRENATNEYRDCDVIIFVGLNHKPPYAVRALLAGEGYKGDLSGILEDVKAGELIQQLQQGIGRGQMRQGSRQYVYFPYPHPEIFIHDLQRAFPACEIKGIENPYRPDPPEEEDIALDSELSF